VQARPLIFVTYDGMANSVFAGQVLQPLIARLEQNSDAHIWLVSFESLRASEQPDICQPFPDDCSRQSKEMTDRSGISQSFPDDCSRQSKEMTDRLHTTILTKIPFLTTASLWPAIYQLKKFLKQFDSYELMARGPLAGFICQRALQPHACASLTIQARGLLAQEYAYAHQHTRNTFARWWHAWRTKQFERIEYTAYHSKRPPSVRAIALLRTGFDTSGLFKIQAVSPALKEYVIKHFGANPKNITIAHNDIPQPISSQDKTAWRTAIRKTLHINHDTHVYCYNGSAKPWQCPQDILTFFKQQHTNNANSFLLILTQDKAAFAALAQTHQLAPASYHICSVEHHDIYRYLAACDTGIMFREPHIINWVSRPTKILEYRAAGLTVKHNNTVGYLAQAKGQN